MQPDTGLHFCNSGRHDGLSFEGPEVASPGRIVSRGHRSPETATDRNAQPGTSRRLMRPRPARVARVRC